MGHHVLEVVRGRFEGLLEVLTDAPIGLADEPPQLREGAFQVGALALELIDVGHRLLVLRFCQGVHGPELLAPSPEALDPGLELGRALVAELLGGGVGRQPELGRHVAQRGLGVGGGVADLLGCNLGCRDPLKRRPQLRLQLGLGVGAGPSSAAVCSPTSAPAECWASSAATCAATAPRAASSAPAARAAASATPRSRWIRAFSRRARSLRSACSRAIVAVMER